MSLRVVHTFGRNAGAVAELDKGVVRFGRAPENDVVFDPEYDRDASGLHAEARREGDAWVLVDLGSRNGTFVRGRKIDRCVLQAGDEITFGAQGPRVRIEIVAGAPLRASAGPAQSGAPRVKSGTVAMDPEPAALSQQPARRKQPLPGTAAYPVVAALPAPPPAPPPAYRAGPAGVPAGAHRPAPQAGAPFQAAPPAGQRVGQRTIAALISSAVASARGRAPQKMNTRVLRDYVDREVNVATAGQRRTTTVLAALFVAALAGLASLVVWSRWSSDEIDRLRTDLAGMSPEDPHRKDIEGRLGSLHPANASFGRNLYDQSRKGIFMLASGGQGFCTAFAVRPSVLATNAHCVAAAKRQGGTIVALENEGRGAVSFSVADMRQHPGYRDGDASAITPDVGIVNISGRAATVLTLATAQELAAMGAGDDVYLIGFPGRLMDASNPTATFLAAHVGRITSAGGRPGGFADTWLVQHDAPTTHGTSGSPIFDGKGHVIAINAGGYMEGDEETVSGRKTEVVKASPYKFGMRIDLLNAILR